MILQTGRTQDVKLGSYTGWGNLPVSNRRGGGEDIPAGGWRGGGEDIPAGGWRGGGEDIPAGGWRGGGEDIPAGGWRGGGEDIPAGGWRGGGEDIPAGGWRAIIDVYRSVDGLSYFKFSFYPIGDYYEIDILAMPSYGNRDSGLHNTHRLTSGRGGYKICFGDPTFVKTVVAARKWAAYWSEHTLNYIRSGTPFPNS
jgi:hypothetical protein